MITTGTERTGRRHTPVGVTHRPVGPDDPRLPRMRVTIFWWAPFDRPIVLTALTTASAMLAVWATPTPVRIIGAVIAVASFLVARRVWRREWRTAPADRGCDVTVDEIGGEW